MADGGQPEQHEQQEEVLEPRPIEDLGPASSGMNWASKDGATFSATIRAKIEGGEFKCLPEDTGETVDFGFEVTATKDAMDKARDPQADVLKIPPALITEVIPAVDESKKPTDQFIFNKRDIEARALQHNAFMILGWLSRGGSIDALPKTKYMPDLERLQKGEVVKMKPPAPPAS